MPVTFVRGDIFLSRAQAIGLGTNAAGAVEVTPLASAGMQHYPAAYASFRKQARAGRIRAGQWWVWREGTPWLALLVVRQNGVGASRLRYVDGVAQKIARDFHLESLRSLAIAPLGDSLEWPDLRRTLTYWLEISALPVVIYEEHIPGVQAVEPWDD